MRRGDRTENVCRSTRVYVTRNAVVKSVQNMPPDLNLQNTRPKTLATADPPTMMSMMPTSALVNNFKFAPCLDLVFAYEKS